MATQTLHAVSKSLDTPDETRNIGTGILELVNLNGLIIGRATLPPGWQWSKDVKSIAGTDTCQASHTQYIISGGLVIDMDDGTKMVLNAGDAAIIPPGHDAYVTGDEPCVLVDFGGMKDYAKQP